MDLRKAESPRERFRPPSILSEKIQKSNAPSMGPKNHSIEAPSSIKNSKSPRSLTPSPINNAMNRPQSPFLLKRSQSAERRRPETPTRISPSKSRSSTISSPSSRSSTPVRDVLENPAFALRRRGSGRMPDGLWPSTRSLSASFQGESISGHLRKGDKLLSNSNSNLNNAQKVERKRSVSNGKNARDHSENLKPAENRWPSSLNFKVLTKPMSMSVDLNDKSSRLISSPALFRSVSPIRKANITNNTHRGPQKAGDKVIKQVREVPVKSLERETPLTRPRRTVSLPSLPSKISSPSPSFRPPSPSSFSRRSTSSENPKSQTGFSSSQSYMVNAGRGKKSANQMEAAHQLRLLHNRNLQWRFVNARADASTSVQRMTSESILQNVWINISEMRPSAVRKKVTIEQLRQEMKLGSILKEQMSFLEDWGFWETDHSNALSGVTKSLKSSILQLPLTSGAKADVPKLKNAINSAIGVMHELFRSINHLHFRMADKFSNMSELAELASLERDMLQECRELLSYLAALQVQEFSLRTHLLQLRRDMIWRKPVLTVGV